MKSVGKVDMVVLLKIVGAAMLRLCSFYGNELAALAITILVHPEMINTGSFAKLFLVR
jgi:hypothetical protein